MKPQAFQLKFFAAFVLLLVCLNAAGAVCVAYCRSVVLSAMDEHCPLAKEERHCDKPAASNDGEESALASGEIDCCPMIVSFIPGTLEPKQTFITATTVVAASKFVISPLVVFSKYRFVKLPAYRGPPKDGRVLHITNRILRI